MDRLETWLASVINVEAWIGVLEKNGNVNITLTFLANFRHAIHKEN